jgi:hypothetical protein
LDAVDLQGGYGVFDFRDPYVFVLTHIIAPSAYGGHAELAVVDVTPPSDVSQVGLLRLNTRNSFTLRPDGLIYAGNSMTTTCYGNVNSG